MRSPSTLIGAAVLALCGSARANPVMMLNEVYVEQFPGTNHVQITRTYSSYGPATTIVTRDGSTVDVKFDTHPGGSRDLGSGMSSLTLVVGCDCSVPIGRQYYVVANANLTLDVVDASAATRTIRTPSAQCDVNCPNVTPIATGGTGGVGSGGAAASTSGGTTSTAGNGGSTATGGTTSASNGGATSPTSGGEASMGGADQATATGGTTSATTGGAPPSATGGTSSVSTVGNPSTTGGAVSMGVTGDPTLTGGATSSIGGRAGTGIPPKTGGTGTGASAATEDTKPSDSSGCTISLTASSRWSMAVLAVLGLLSFRRRK